MKRNVRDVAEALLSLNITGIGDVDNDQVFPYNIAKFSGPC